MENMNSLKCLVECFDGFCIDRYGFMLTYANCRKGEDEVLWNLTLQSYEKEGWTRNSGNDLLEVVSRFKDYCFYHNFNWSMNKIQYFVATGTFELEIIMKDDKKEGEKQDNV